MKIKNVKQIELILKNILKKYFKLVPLLFLIFYYYFISNDQSISFLKKVIILSVMILFSLLVLNKNSTSKKHFKFSIIFITLSTLTIIIAIFTYKIVVIYYT